MKPAFDSGEDFLQSLKSLPQQPRELGQFCGFCNSALVYCDFQFWRYDSEKDDACTVPLAFCPLCDGLPQECEAASS